MRTREIMSSPVVTVTPTTRLKEVATLLVRYGFTAVPVVEDGRLVGIVSEADLVPLEATPDRRAHHLPVPAAADAGQGRRPPRTVGEVMTREVCTLPDDADVADAARLMLTRGIRSIPIMRGQRVVGIVSRRDLVRVLARSDHAIEVEVARLLVEELGEGAGRLRVEVVDGVVTLGGTGDAVIWELAELLAGTVPGVVAVKVDGTGSAGPMSGVRDAARDPEQRR